VYATLGADDFHNCICLKKRMLVGENHTCITERWFCFCFFATVAPRQPHRLTMMNPHKTTIENPERAMVLLLLLLGG
jgi:hypothetical protein